MTDANKTDSTLITLAGLDSLAQPLLIDCSHGPTPDAGLTRYLSGHLPGARHLHLDRDLSAPLRSDGIGGRHPLPEIVVFEQTLRRHGLRDGQPVVAYDASGGPYAARLWWMLRWLGHTAAYVLDGGLQAWTDAGRALEQGPAVEVSVGDWVARPQAGWVIDREVARGLAAEGALVDCRSPERYRGEVEPLDPVAGHIPGARNVFWQSLLDEDGKLVGTPDVPEGGAVYCGSGVTACVVALALAHQGRHAPMYPGSWSDWLASGGPVATGE